LIQPTEEQNQILQAFLSGQSIKIHAFAGTGKTSTLFYLASQTNKEGLYLTFNKRIAEEAKIKMPKNVTSATVHSLA
jgi:excinuclease UvrABC helicase subunit UvrB